MKLSLVVVVLQLIALVTRTASVDLICNYGFRDAHNKVYACNVDRRVDFSHSHRAIDAVSGEHVSGMEASDVVAFTIDSVPHVKYFPQSVEKFFAHLKLVHVIRTDLAFIYRGDLKPFPHLQLLNLCNNQLRTIERNLFEFNLELEIVWLAYNKISHIDPYVFSALHRLHSLNLTRNHCNMQTGSADSRVDVKVLVKRIETGECLNLKVHMEMYEQTLLDLNQIRNLDANLLQQALESGERFAHKVDTISNIVMALALLTATSLIISTAACFRMRNRRKEEEATENGCNVNIELRDVDSFCESLDEDAAYSKIRKNATNAVQQ